MSWPEEPLTRSLEDWQRWVEERGRALRRRRQGLLAASVSAAFGVVAVVPLALLTPSDAAPDRLRVVTPATSAVPRPASSPRTDVHFSRGSVVRSSSSQVPAPSTSRAVGTRLGPVAVTAAVPPFATARELSCTPSRFGTASCPGSGVRLDPSTGLLWPTAYVRTGSGGTAADWYASSTAVGTATAVLRVARPARQVRVVVSYRVTRSPAVATAPGNSASNTFVVTATPRLCRVCAGTAQEVLVTGTPVGTVATAVLTLTNPYGLVPDGWVDVVVAVRSFATIGVCDSPCGEPGVGDARAEAGVLVRQVRLG